MANRPPRRRRRLSKAELKKRRRRAYTARFLLVLVCLAVLFLIISGVRAIVRKASGRDTAKRETKEILGGSEEETSGGDEAEVFIEFKKNGSLIETVTESFDGEEYSQDELRAMAESEIAGYNEEAGDEKLKLVELKFKDDRAEISIEYASDEDYSAFNGEEIVFKKIADLSDMVFTESLNKVGSGETVEPQEVKNIKGTAIILNADAEIKVPKKIKYFSGGVELIGKKDAIVTKDEDNSFIIY